MGSEAFLFDIKIISLYRTAVKRGTQKKSPPRRRCGKGRPSCLENVETLPDKTGKERQRLYLAAVCKRCMARSRAILVW